MVFSKINLENARFGTAFVERERERERERLEARAGDTLILLCVALFCVYNYVFFRKFAFRGWWLLPVLIINPII